MFTSTLPPAGLSVAVLSVDLAVASLAVASAFVLLSLSVLLAAADILSDVFSGVLSVVLSAAFTLPLSDALPFSDALTLSVDFVSALAGSFGSVAVTKPLSLSISASFTPAFDNPDTDLYGRPAMIFLAVASPTPGSSWRSFSLAVLRSTFSLVFVSAAVAGAATILAAIIKIAAPVAKRDQRLQREFKIVMRFSLQGSSD